MFVSQTDVVLPIGEYSIRVTVIDSNGAYTTYIAQNICNISIVDDYDEEQNSNISSSTLSDIMNENGATFVSTHARYLHYFQTMEAILIYLIDDYHNTKKNEETIMNQLDQLYFLIDSMYQQFSNGSTANNLCQTTYVVVCTFVLCCFDMFFLWLVFAKLKIADLTRVHVGTTALNANNCHIINAYSYYNRQ